MSGQRLASRRLLVSGGEAELRAMAFADANVLDESEDLDVPRHGRSDVRHRQDRRHTRVRRGPVRQHPFTLDRRVPFLASPSGVRTSSSRRPDQVRQVHGPADAIWAEGRRLSGHPRRTVPQAEPLRTPVRPG
jgi:hypothetical protein